MTRKSLLISGLAVVLGTIGLVLLAFGFPTLALIFALVLLTMSVALTVYLVSALRSQLATNTRRLENRISKLYDGAVQLSKNNSVSTTAQSSAPVSEHEIRSLIRTELKKQTQSLQRGEHIRSSIQTSRHDALLLRTDQITRMLRDCTGVTGFKSQDFNPKESSLVAPLNVIDSDKSNYEDIDTTVETIAKHHTESLHSIDALIRQIKSDTSLSDDRKQFLTDRLYSALTQASPSF